jgi:hypothetical protein
VNPARPSYCGHKRYPERSRPLKGIIQVDESINIADIPPSVRLLIFILNQIRDPTMGWLGASVRNIFHKHNSSSRNAVLTFIGLATMNHKTANMFLECTTESSGRTKQISLSRRILATILFTDIVGSTERARELGDRVWRDLLWAHDATVRREISRFRG